MTDPDVAAIAGKLTKAQRHHVERGSFSGDFSMATANALYRKGLFDVRIDSPNGQWGTLELTDLGQRVRDHIIRSERDA